MLVFRNQTVLFEEQQNLKKHTHGHVPHKVGTLSQQGFHTHPHEVIIKTCHCLQCGTVEISNRLSLTTQFCLLV